MTTQTLTPREALQLCASEPKAFLTGFFYTLPGPDDPAIGPRLCDLWPGVSDLLDALIHHQRVIGLKSRKIGFTTTGLAFALWGATFSSHYRAHLFSYRDDAAQDLIRRVKFAYKKLPDWMRLPLAEGESANDKHTLSLVGTQFSGDPSDVRVIKAYPTTEEASADEVADFVMIDEAARIRRLHEVYAAVEPTVRRWLLMISSGRGPDGEFVETWQAAKSGDLGIVPRFYPWSARPDRTAAWRTQKLREFTLKDRGAREYPETEDDAFLGDAAYAFSGDAIDAAHDDAVGLLGEARGDREYVHGWDIGKLQDAAVGIVLDITEPPYQIVAYVRRLGLPYPVLQTEIETLFDRFGGELRIENNGPGEPVIDNLEIPAIGITTGPKSKVVMIAQLKAAVEGGNLRWRGLPQLDREMRGYQWEDKSIVQDSVMSLAIALSGAQLGDPIGVG